MTLGTIVWFILIGGLFFFMMKKGGGCCGGHDHGGSNHQGHDGADTGREMDLGDHNHTERVDSPDGPDKDSVCGMAVDKISPAAEYLGRTFHFCSEQCRKVFDLNPKKYVGSDKG